MSGMKKKIVGYPPKRKTRVYPKSKFFKPHTHTTGFTREVTAKGKKTASKDSHVYRETLYRDKNGHIIKRTQRPYK